MTTTYRPAIDGLRALAVLAVVVYHAFPAALPGGFAAGVDIFFVISGYLISGIILDQEAAGGFSLTGFYRRRINRLFPCLVAVLAACLAAGQAFLLSDELAQLGKHAACGAAFAQNIALWREGGYFDHAALAKPLLHLWTLAIEEQFYLAYPLLLLAALRWTGRPLLAIVLVGLASFIANIALIDEHPRAVFYGFGTRAWELLAGGALSCLQRAPRTAARLQVWSSSRSGAACSWTGLILIGAACGLLSSDLAYPGWWGALPVAGTVLLLAAGPGAVLNARLLSHPALVGIGLISYPLYLWHWPLLSFWAIISPDADSATVRALLVLSSVVLAILSYRLLECRLRRNPASWVTPGLVGALALVATVGVLDWAGVIPSRFARSHFNLLIHHAIGDWHVPGGMTAAGAGDAAYVTAGGQGRMTLYWGDSHAQQYEPLLHQLVAGNPAQGRGVMVLAQGSVPPLPGVVQDADRLLCAGNERRFRLLAGEPRVDTIVLAARWSRYFEPEAGYSFAQDGRRYALATAAGRERALGALSALLAELKATGRTIYLVQDNPAGRELDPTHIYQRGFLNGGFRIQAEGVDAAAMIARFAPIRAALDAIAAKRGLLIIDPLPLLVRDGRFPALTDQGEPIYMDGDHFRATSARTLIRYLDATMRDPPQ